VSVTIYPQYPGPDSKIYFTIIAKDEDLGSGIANTTLYIDDIAVESSTIFGIHSFMGGPYSVGTHKYRVEAVDNSNNRSVDPVSGNYDFMVSGSTVDSASLRIGLTFTSLITALIAAIVWFLVRRKSNV